MTTESKHRFIINFFYFIIMITVAYFIFKYAIGFLMPFLIAYIIAAAVRPFSKLLEQRIKLSHKLAALISVTLFYCTIGALAFAVCAQVYSFVSGQVATKLYPFYKSRIEPMLGTLLGGKMKLPDDFDPTVAAAITGISSNLIGYVGDAVKNLSQTIGLYLGSFAMSLPTIVLKVVFSIVASFYFTADYDLIREFIEKQFGESSYRKFDAARGAVREIILSYIKSYAIILGITFAELTAAFFILRVPGAVILALLIAVFDILPVVGTGTILVPWTVVEFLNGEYGLGAGLLVTYVVIFIVRNIIEPKIVGHGVGLHPLVTLLAMFVGTMLFGVVGLFGIPITMALIVDLNDKEVIKLFNK